MQISLPSLALLLFASGSLAQASVEIATTSVPNGTVNTKYSAVISATNGCAPYVWSIVSGALPAGITKRVSSSTTSLNLSGTPTIAGSDSFTVSVKGCGGIVAKASYKIVIQSTQGSSVAIVTTSVPNGTVNTKYSAVISATNGCTPYAWSIASGALPAGITKNVSSSTTSLGLSGTPTRASSNSFTVSVKGCGGSVSTKTYKIVIQSTANHVVDLQWKPSTSRDITGYNVYRSPDGVTWKRSNVSLIGSTFFSDSTVANGSTYYYAATTVDISGHESGRSASIRVAVP